MKNIVLQFIHESLKEIDQVGIAVIVKNDTVLALKRGSTAPWKPNTWAMAGGGQEGNETLLQTALRELKEETSLIGTAKSSNLLYKYHNQADNYVAEFYLIQVDKNQEVKLDYENSEFKWITLKEVDNMIWASKEVPYVAKKVLLAINSK